MPRDLGPRSLAQCLGVSTSNLVFATNHHGSPFDVQYMLPSLGAGSTSVENIFHRGLLMDVAAEFEKKHGRSPFSHRSLLLRFSSSVVAETEGDDSSSNPLGRLARTNTAVINAIELLATNPSTLIDAAKRDASAMTVEAWVRKSSVPSAESRSGSTEGGATWHKFWWWIKNQDWPFDASDPASISKGDVLGSPFGSCEMKDKHCFQRLPPHLDEDYTEIMAEEDDGKKRRLVWRFDSRNTVAHAAWRAFRHGEETLSPSQGGTGHVRGRNRFANYVGNGNFRAGRGALNEKSSKGTVLDGSTTKALDCVAGALICGATRSIVRFSHGNGPPRQEFAANSGFGLRFDAGENELAKNLKGEYHVFPRPDAGGKGTGTIDRSGLFRVEGWVRLSEDWSGVPKNANGASPPVFSVTFRDASGIDIGVASSKSADDLAKNTWLLVEFEFDSVQEAAAKAGAAEKPSSIVSTFEFVVNGGTRKGVLEVTGLGVFAGQSWNPRPINKVSGSATIFSGNEQTTFMYRKPTAGSGMPSSAAFSSLLLTTTPEDCDCKSTLSLGHGICKPAGDNSGYTYGTSDFGVDVLDGDGNGGNKECSVPHKSRSVTIYYRDIRDAVPNAGLPGQSSTKLAASVGRVERRQIAEPPRTRVGVDMWVRTSPESASGPAAKAGLVGWWDASKDSTLEMVEGNLRRWKTKHNRPGPLPPLDLMQTSNKERRPWRSSGPTRWSGAVRFSPVFPESVAVPAGGGSSGGGETATTWKHVMTAGCASVITAGTFRAEFPAEPCWKGFTDDEINEFMHVPSSELKIEFGDVEKNLYVKLMDETTSGLQMGQKVREWASDPNPNYAQWRWSEEEDWRGPCTQSSQSTLGYWFMFKADGPEGNCQSDNYENTVDSLNGFTNEDGSAFFPQMGWDSSIKVYVRTEEPIGFCSSPSNTASATSTWDSSGEQPRTLSSSGNPTSVGVNFGSFSAFVVMRCDGNNPWPQQDILGTGSKGATGDVSIGLTSAGRIRARHWSGSWKLLHKRVSGTRTLADSETFNNYFAASPTKILKRTCTSCNDDFKEVYYKRLTPLTSDAHKIFAQYGWDKGDNNVRGTDFDLFSTYKDALAGTNAWNFCAFDSSSLGFPGRCGKCRLQDNDAQSIDKQNNWNLYVDMQSSANAEGKLQLCGTSPVGTSVGGETSPWWIVGVRSDTNNVNVWLNGEDEASSPILGVSDASTTSRRALVLGGYAHDKVGFSGDVSEVILYETALSDRDMLDVTRYLSSRWSTGQSSVAGMDSPAEERGRIWRRWRWLGKLWPWRDIYLRELQVDQGCFPRQAQRRKPLVRHVQPRVLQARAEGACCRTVRKCRDACRFKDIPKSIWYPRAIRKSFIAFERQHDEHSQKDVCVCGY